jgi:hypothetical protein
MNKVLYILLNTLPILLMISLIPFIQNDYLLTAVYAAIIVIALTVHREPKDIIVFSFGFVIMIASEYVFVSTGVETFIRNSLFGLMPLWLPFLWGYGFIAIKRCVRVL